MRPASPATSRRRSTRSTSSRATGTYNEVLNGLTGWTSRRVPARWREKSVLPRALGLPRDPVAAARRLARRRTRRIALGRANGRRFGFSAGVGLDAELVRRVDALGRRPDGRRPGDSAFVRSGAGARSGAWVPARPGSRGGWGRSGRVRARREREPIHVRGASPAALRTRRIVEAASTSSPRLRCPACRFRSSRGGHSGVAARTCASTTPRTSSWSVASRCRCSSTARISAMSSGSCSRRSRTPSPSSSRGRTPEAARSP